MAAAHVGQKVLCALVGMNVAVLKNVLTLAYSSARLCVAVQVQSPVQR